MYCKHCGKQIDDDAKFCPECGGSVASRSVDVDQAVIGKQENVLSKPITVKNTPWPTSKPQSKRERVKENKQNGVACCPKCGSTSLSANKKGFGVGKAVVGAALTGGIGLVAGNIGAKKVWVTCLNCGHRWKM
jgi:RNA polymerase subunit RPABC4/transcription elongation factor Spt4